MIMVQCDVWLSSTRTKGRVISQVCSDDAASFSFVRGEVGA